MKFVVKEISPGVYELAQIQVVTRTIIKRETFKGNTQDFMRALFKCKLAGFDIECV